MTKEETFEERTKEVLEQNGLVVYGVTFTFAGGNPNGLLSITMYGKQELRDLLKFLNYSGICDKSGFEIFWDTSTVILTGMALMGLCI